MSNEINTIIKEKAKEVIQDTVNSLKEEPYNCTDIEIGMALTDIVNKEDLIKGLNAGKKLPQVQGMEKEST